MCQRRLLYSRRRNFGKAIATPLTWRDQQVMKKQPVNQSHQNYHLNRINRAMTRRPQPGTRGPGCHPARQLATASWSDYQSDRSLASCPPRAAEVFRREWKQMPRPLGFWQMAVILEKEGNYADAIELATQALEQGWAGDWERRITRCKQRLTRKR
jgi:hypothetical protein